MVICPQCGQVAEASSVRLVQDSCGHKKCRACLLTEESGCLSCQKTPSPVFIDLQRAPSPLSEPIFSNSVNDRFSDSSCTKFDNCSPLQSCCVEQNQPDLISTFNQEDKNKDLPENLNKIKPPEEKEDKGRKRLQTANSSRNNNRKKRQLIGLKEHIIITPGDPPLYFCKVCNKSYNNRKAARYHNYCGTSDEEKPFKCAVCEQGFVTSGHFSYHMKTHTGALPFSCDVCGKGFKQSSKLTRHKKSHEGEKPYKCDICSRNFCAKHVLKDHMLSHNADRTLSCSVCNKKLSSKSCLRKHKLLHKDPKHKCDVCGKSFSIKWNLEIHKKTHIRDRKHKCKQCGRGFKILSDLKRHALVHQDDGAWNCKLCDLTFRRKDNLVRHVKNIHTESQQCLLDKKEPNMPTQSETELNKSKKRVEVCAATPPAPHAVSVIRSWAVPVIQKLTPPQTTDTVKGDVVKSFVPTITKATHIVQQDASGMPKVHTIVTTTPLNAELSSKNSNVLPTDDHWQESADSIMNLDSSEQNYFSISDQLRIPGKDKINASNQCSLSSDQKLQRESVVRHPESRVIHFGSSAYGIVPVTQVDNLSNLKQRNDTSTLETNSVLSVSGSPKNAEKSSVWRPRVIVVKENCDIRNNTN